MNKVKLPWGKRTLLTVLSLGLMVLGIGSISWAMYRMWSPQFDYIADSDRSSNPITSTLTTELNPNLNNTFPEPDNPLYTVYPAEGDKIGSLTIPTLKRELPIFQGTDKEELSKGVGHFTKSILPGEEDNCVLSGHRDTVFRQLDKLKIGDQLIVQTKAGTFTYEVENTRIVHGDDETVIVPTENAILTLTTCYPFYAIGDAPDRYIVSAALVKSNTKSN